MGEAGLNEHGSSATEMTFVFRQKSSWKRAGRNPVDTNGIPKAGNVPRVSRLMAMAIRFDGLIGGGKIKDYADLARLGCVSRARVTQIMNLLNLAPDIQEEILFLPKTTKGHDFLRERNLRAITTEPHWQRQRKIWFNQNTGGLV